MNSLPKEQWIKEVYRLYCAALQPSNDIERKNLRGCAETLADCDIAYYEEGMTPKEAFDEEMSCF